MAVGAVEAAQRGQFVLPCFVAGFPDHPGFFGVEEFLAVATARQDAIWGESRAGWNAPWASRCPVASCASDSYP